MEGSHHLGALTHRGGNTLDRARAHIADGEDTTAACLERPTVGAEIESRSHETLFVELDLRIREPGGVGIGADEEEQMTDFAPHLVFPFRPPADGIELAILSLKLGHGVARHYLHVPIRCDAVGAILRHAHIYTRAA